MSDRIRRLASFVRPHSVLYDLCCDHGYIGLTAWDQKPLAGLVFVDQSPNALRAVHEALKARALTDDPRVQVINGPAEKIKLDARPSDLVMAGVGIRTIVTIIRALFSEGLGPHRLIICPEKNSLELRSFLLTQTLGLVAEDVVMEAERFREIIVLEEKGGPIHLLGEGYANRQDPHVQNFVVSLRAWYAAVTKNREARPAP
ncbi:tRNA (adenine(22)-N(1))-methyltransferase TrmK [Oligoflexus tunisiensis]|uniref:tRNA (adenine(22)-N(1))-methyltransferase TrmK n=1 Tax=Oligoflexus tunisiensis TaxID=708132 RepID=UPI00114CF99E|nr:tRNA (adenine(22)-N(1))-methyltransferase TrmK [Oligoflexus tunisiensis]